jgi:single-stranded-DNA-specific exonuclease
MRQNSNPNPIWIYPDTDPAWTETIVREFNIHPVTAQVLASRGFKDVETIHDFLYAILPHLHDPHLFPDMEKAVERILTAFRTKENILIYGDNDVDGITAAALLTEFLRFTGLNVFYYVPNRNALKQSLILDALDYAKKNRCSLLITVDCGITAANEIRRVSKKMSTLSSPIITNQPINYRIASLH